MVRGGGIPIDSPLYEVDLDRGAEYWGCKALVALFTTSQPLEDLIPDGLKLVGDSPIGMTLLASYGNSTLGPYNEFVSLVQVTDETGTLGMYIPYIYVTNDAALAAGREVLGAPKKLAQIELSNEYELVQGTLCRPSTKRLVSMVVRPSTRMDISVLKAFMPEDMPFYSLRYLPAPPGGTSARELVKWHSRMTIQRDSSGNELLFTGPGSLEYDSHSPIDPVYRIDVGSLLACLYLEFDLRLCDAQVIRSETWREELK